MSFTLTGNLLGVQVRRTKDGTKEYAVAEILTAGGGRHSVQVVFVPVEDVPDLSKAVGTEVTLPVDVRVNNGRLMVSSNG